MVRSSDRVTVRAGGHRDGVALHRHHRDPLVVHARPDDDVGAVQRVGPVGGAQAGGDVRAEVGELQRRAGRHGLLDVDGGGQRRVVDVHELRGVGGGRRALGDDHGDGLADEPHPVGRQRRPRHLGVHGEQAVVGGKVQVRGGEHGDDARSRRCRGRVDPGQLGVRHRRPHEVQVQGAGQREVADVGRPPRDQFRVLDPPDRRSENGSRHVGEATPSAGGSHARGGPGHHARRGYAPYRHGVPEFHHTDVLPLGPDATEYRRLDLPAGDLVDVPALGRQFLQVPPATLTALVRTAVRDISHLLRPSHLAQLRAIIDDPEASANDRFVATDLLRNACVSAGGVLPMCQDTGTAIVVGKRTETVLTGGNDEEAISRGVFEAYDSLNLRYSQMAPTSFWDERNTGTNLPAQVELYSVPGATPRYELLVMAKGGGSANKTFLYQETKALLNPKRLATFLDEKLRSLGTAACPPYHLAIVVGGMSAEFTLKVAKLASARYLDTLPESGSEVGYAFRDRDLEQQVLELTRGFGIGAQFGGKYFCHDVRVIRLPRHGASLPVGIAVSCSADRQAKAKITADGVFLEQLERDPARFLPDVTHEHLDERGRGRADRPEPADGGDPRPALGAAGEDPGVADRAAGGGPGHRAREDRRAAGGGRADARLPA